MNTQREPVGSTGPDSSLCRRPTSRFRSVAWLLAVLVLVAGCRLAKETARLPGQVVSAVVPGSKSGQPDPATLQADLQRYADEFTGRCVAALDEYARVVDTPEARDQALQWKVSVSSAAVSIASGPNPTANLLDFLSLATILRTVLEEHWTQSAEGKRFQPWLETSRSLETEAWRLAAGIFTPGQQQELRDSIRQWWDANSGARSTFFARPQAFASLIRQTGQKTDQPGSVFGLVGLDPTSGLDPAVREVTRTRLFAERAMYAAERMPFLVRWQIELLTAQFLQNPDVSAVLTNAARLTESADRMSRAAESASQTAALLPDRLSTERKAILEALEAQEGRLRELSAEVGRTLAAGERMSTSLNTTIHAFDALMKRFGVGEPSSAPPDTNSPPFNILDYARTADQIATMAQQLDALIKDSTGTLDSPALDKRIADLNALAARARADARSVLNHAFLLAAGLIVLAFACATVYRRIHRTLA
jgi:hypothetical protein